MSLFCGITVLESRLMRPDFKTLDLYSLQMFHLVNSCSERDSIRYRKELELWVQALTPCLMAVLLTVLSVTDNLLAVQSTHL